ncbi:MAG: sigma 54-interacting transcriptional regulator [Planctomycetes bacterium]|nr:sigma 54-interacting transcriptional regulator [Planctomycetota bacterium]
MPANVPAVAEHRSRHVRELNALYQVSRILASETMQRQMFAAVLDVLHHDLGLLRGTVLLLSPDGQELMLEVSHGLTPTSSVRPRYRRGEGVVGRVLETGKPAIIPKVSQEPQFLDRIHRRRSTTGEEFSFICVPVALENTPLGVLSVDRVYDPQASLDEDVRVLSIVASLIANDVRSRRAAEAERQTLEEENRRLLNEMEDRFRPENIIGNSNAMREVYRAIHQVAGTDTTVLIRGESGTGKELVAHALHYSSPRARGPFVRVNCAALSESLLESELFGHEKGAFTGAVEMRKGRIEEAEGGTLFLDEIGDFSPSVQVKLLRVLQEKEFQRVGSSATRAANVRILTATNRDLEAAVTTERFRQDLYYRINVFPIFLPPLRDRKDDILQLADHFIAKYTRQLNKDVRRISTPAINMMVAYHWPGNVRELENCIERAVLLSTDGVIRGHHLPPSLQTAEASDTVGAGTLAERVDLFERDIIVDALKRTEGNMALAARDLGTTARVLRYKVNHLGVDYRLYRRR